MSAAAETYTEAERLAYEEGREAYKARVDYFDSPHMRQSPRDLYTLCAWTAGWLAAEAAEHAVEF
jgi:hypothetical protein